MNLPISFLIIATSTASAFYNPQAGRWLTRDPVGEQGGRNMNVFVRNNSVQRVDSLGLAEFRWISPDENRHPVTEKYQYPGGFTTWASFAPEAAVVTESCCYKVKLSGGAAQARIDYIAGSAFTGEDALTHERYHAEFHFKVAYDDFKNAASAFGETCMTKARAACIRQVVVEELASQYNSRAIRDGYLYDWGTYGWQLDNPEDFWAGVAGSMRDYDDRQATTTAAINACPQ